MKDLSYIYGMEDKKFFNKKEVSDSVPFMCIIGAFYGLDIRHTDEARAIIKIYLANLN